MSKKAARESGAPGRSGVVRMLDPVIESPIKRARAADKLSTLNGKVIGLYSNSKLNATKVLEMSAEIIRQRFQPGQFVLVEGDIHMGHDMSDERHWKEPVDLALVAVGD